MYSLAHLTLQESHRTMSKLAVQAIDIFRHLASTGTRGRIMQKFLAGLLKVIHPRGKVVDENLSLAYPDSPKQWRKDIRESMYDNLAWTITEILALQRKPSQVFDWVKTVRNIELADSLIDTKRGVVFMSGHFGNWEIMASWYAQYTKIRGHQMYVVAQGIHDNDISAYIDGLRKNMGVETLPSDYSVQKYARLLKAGNHIALLNDVAGTGKMIVPFMGHDATNMPGPAIMAMLSGSPIIPVCMYRNAPFEHELEFFPPIEMPEESLPREERLRRIILECNLAIERFIRKRPELWFWLHKRWRP